MQVISRRRFAGTLGALAMSGLLRSNAKSQAQESPAEERHDLIVVGIGSGGFGAACAAAQQGLNVLCIEKAGQVGGNAVASGVTMWEPGVGGTGLPFLIYRRLKATPWATAIYSTGRHFSWDGQQAFPGGEAVPDLTRAYADTLRRHRGDGLPADTAFKKEYWHGVVFEPAAYEGVLRAMLQETGRVTLFTETLFEKAEVQDGVVTGLVLSNGKRVSARAYVDGTGGGELCKACGCEVMYGQESAGRFGEEGAPEQPNSLTNGATLIFRIAPADTKAVEPLPEGIPDKCWWGSFPAMSAVQYPNGGYNCNMLPTMSGEELAKMASAAAYEECRRRVYAFWNHVQRGWPEFQRYRIAWLAPALGVRETTRLVGEYVLTLHDLRAGISKQQHPDIVTIADHSIDRHGTGGLGGEVMEPYGVPYRCLIPKGFKNLLISCRGASFSSIAASSCRLSRTMMQLGQAAGTAAAIAQEQGIGLPDVPPEILRARLREQHVQLEWPMSEDIKAYINDETAIRAG